MKREADAAYEAIDHLRSGPITLARDYEWSQFVEHDPHFVSPDLPVRKVEDISYPGKNHPAAAEVRAGMLERKSKYLKSYAPGWYGLSTLIQIFTFANIIQVRAVADSLARIQISGPNLFAATNNVSSSLRTKARLQVTTWLVIAQVHPQR